MPIISSTFQPKPPSIGTRCKQTTFHGCTISVKSAFAILLVPEPDEHNQNRILAVATPLIGDYRLHHADYILMATQ